MSDPTLTRGQRLAAARKSLGWSQRDVGRYLEVAQTWISFAENDDSRVKPIYWRALTHFCDEVEARHIRTEDKPTGEPE